MAEFTFYTTKEGDTWDAISYRAYGDVKYMADIILANEGPVDVDLPAGIVLKIPIKEFANTNIDSVPFWKQ